MKINYLGTDKVTVLDGGGEDDELDIKRFREFLLYTRMSEHLGFTLFGRIWCDTSHSHIWFLLRKFATQTHFHLDHILSINRCEINWLSSRAEQSCDVVKLRISPPATRILWVAQSNFER